MRGFTIHVRYGPVLGAFMADSTRKDDEITITVDDTQLGRLRGRARKLAHRQIITTELARAGLALMSKE